MNIYSVHFPDGQKWYTGESFQSVKGCFPYYTVQYLGKAVNFNTQDIDGHCEEVKQFVCTQRN